MPWFSSLITDEITRESIRKVFSMLNFKEVEDINGARAIEAVADGLVYRVNWWTSQIHPKGGGLARVKVTRQSDGAILVLERCVLWSIAENVANRYHETGKVF